METEAFQFKQLELERGQEYLFFEDLEMTKTHRYGKVNAGFYHFKTYKEPIFLVSNFNLLQIFHVEGK